MNNVGLQLQQVSSSSLMQQVQKNVLLQSKKPSGFSIYFINYIWFAVADNVGHVRLKKNHHIDYNMRIGIYSTIFLH